MKESCHSKVRVFASASQALLAVSETYRATVISEVLVHLCHHLGLQQEAAEGSEMLM